MKRLLLLTAALGGVGFATVGCGTMDSVRCAFLKGRCLTYDEYLSVDPSNVPKATADDVLKKLGTPMAVHDRDGVRRQLDYHCYSLVGDMKVAEFRFDDEEKLVKKELW